MLSEDFFEDDLTYEAMVAIEFYKAFRKGYKEGFRLGELRALRAVQEAEQVFKAIVKDAQQH